MECGSDLAAAARRRGARGNELQQVLVAFLAGKKWWGPHGLVRMFHAAGGLKFGEGNKYFSTHQPHATMMLLRWMLVLVTEFTTACEVRRAIGTLNFGINAGGCYKCDGEDGTAAAGAELLRLCKQLCLSEPNCVTFEISQRPLDAYYEMINPTGLAINCCLEYNAVSAFENPLSMSTATGLCLAEAKCWDSIEPGSTCTRGGTAPAQCTRNEGSFGVHTTDDEIQALRDQTMGVILACCAERLLTAAGRECSQYKERMRSSFSNPDDGSSTTTIIIIIVVASPSLLWRLVPLHRSFCRCKTFGGTSIISVASAEVAQMVQMTQPWRRHSPSPLPRTCCVQGEDEEESVGHYVKRL